MPAEPAHHSSRRQRLRRQQWILGIVCTVAVLGAWRAGWLRRLELPTLDQRAHWFNRWAGGPSPDIVVMPIDQRAVDDVGRWPWGRDVLADAVDALRAAGAKTIALDLLLDDPEPRATGAPGPGPDETLARAFGAHSGIVLPIRSSTDPAADRPALPLVLAHDPGVRDVLSRYDDVLAARVICHRRAAELVATGTASDCADLIGPLLPGVRTLVAAEERCAVAIPSGAGWSAPSPATGVALPVPPLAAAASALGDVGIVGFDPDGVFRRLPLFTNLGGDRMWPTFSLAAVADFLDVNPGQLRPLTGSATEIPTQPPRTIRTTTATVAGQRRPFVHFITWPRGGATFTGQFDDPHSQTPHEVSLALALQPLLIRRAVQSNLQTLVDLLDTAARLNLGDQAIALELARRLRDTPLKSGDWAPILELLADASHPAAAQAADYLAFVGNVDPATLSPEDAAVLERHRAVAEKIPAILTECRAAQDQTSAAQTRLRGIVYGKLVFIGWASAGAVADRVNTSLGPVTPGVYIHAAVASSFLTGFARLPVPALADAAFIGLMGVGGILAARRASVWLAPVLLMVLLAAWFLLAGVVFWDAAWRVVGVAAPSAAASLGWLGVLLHRLLVEQRLRRRTEERFRTYVAPAVVDELFNNPRLDSMTPERRELSIMFCDVAGFTAIAERLGAEGTSRFLSGYLSRMSETLQRHGATIDKYLGDGIMAFWGAPVQDPRHARNACRAAIALARAVADHDAVAQGPAGPLRIRIGLAAGDVMVGDFGNPPVRSSYTVLGDACNVAARLERACKSLGATILVSASIRALAGEGFLWRPMGMIILQGRQAPEPVFELVGLIPPGAREVAGEIISIAGAPGREAVDPRFLGAWIAATEEAVTAFADGRVDEAREKFTALARDFGDGALARVYLDAIEKRAAAGEHAGAPNAIVLSES